MFDEPLALPSLWSDLGQPNRRLHRFNLAEERSETVEIVVSPVQKEPLGLGRHQPVAGTWQLSPLVHLIAKIIDDQSRIVLLLLCRKPFSFIENQSVLGRFSLLLLGFGNRGNELCATSSLNNLLCGLPFTVKLPMAFRGAVRRVQNWAFEKLIIHG